MRIKQWLHTNALFLAVVGLLVKDAKLTLTSSPTLSLSPEAFVPIAPIFANRNITRASNVDALNNQSYIWYGNHWMPPPGVPMYTREDMRKAFSQFETLWIGDSTTRRAFATTFALMSSTDTSISVDDLDHERILDVNKYDRNGYREDSCQKQRRNSKQYLQPGMAKIWGKRSICRRVGGHSFDFIRLECLNDLSKIAELLWEVKRYSLIIIGMGLFDLLVENCGSLPNMGTSTKEENSLHKLDNHTTMALQAAQQMANIMKQAHANDSSPTAVLWRTPGFHANSTQFDINNTFHLTQMSIDFIQKSKLSSNLKVVDWGTAVWPRSFKHQRVKGDIDAHYGLEPRLLMAQMTTQELMKILERSKVP